MLFMVGGFLNEREYSEADFPDLLISYVPKVMCIINVNVTAVLLGEWIFTESAHWANLVSKSHCPSVCNLSTPVTP